MLGIRFADSGYPFHGLLITHMTAKRITRIGGIDDYAAILNNGNGLCYQSFLGVIRMYFEKLAHCDRRELLTPSLYAQAA